LSIPQRYRLLVAVRALRREYASIGPEPSARPEAQNRALFLSAREAMADPSSHDAQAIAKAMTRLADAVPPPPGLIASVLLLAAWLLGIGLALQGGAWAFEQGRYDWTEVRDAGFVVELPSATPRRLTQRTAFLGQSVEVHMLQTTRSVVRRYTVEWWDVPPSIAVDPKAWTDAARDQLSSTYKTIAREEIIPSEHGTASDVSMRTDTRELRARIFVVDRRVYRVSASAPQLDGREVQMLDHFRLTP
jgi:hypothetical protein